MTIGGVDPGRTSSAEASGQRDEPVSVEARIGYGDDLQGESFSFYGVRAERALMGATSLGAEGGVLSINDPFSGQPQAMRPYVGGGVTQTFDVGGTPYVSGNYFASFGQGGTEHRLGVRAGTQLPIRRMSVGAFVGVDVALGQPVTTRWSRQVGITIGFR